MRTDLLFSAVVGLAIALVGWGIIQLLWMGHRARTARLLRRIQSEGQRPPQRVSLQKLPDELPGMLGRSPWLFRFANQLHHAFPQVHIVTFLVVVISIAVALTLGVWLLTDWAMMAGIIGALALLVPCIIVSQRYSMRQRLLTGQLVDALDFLSRVLRAGHSLSTGFNLMGEELPEPIASEFRHCYQQHTLGHPLENAMLEMAARVDLTDFSFFVTSVIIQRQTGGDLTEILDHISTTVRNRLRVQQHLKALTAEGRATGIILAMLPVVVLILIFLINPSYAGILFNKTIGRWMLGIAAGLEIAGLFLIRRIVSFRP